MIDTEKVVWKFYGYRTPNLREDVQEWFDSLSDEERDETTDVFGYLQPLPKTMWGKPEFEPLDHGISEIRIKVNALNHRVIYRIYGAFWPERQRYSYTLLVAKNKKVDNDRRGKKEAIARLKQLERKEATIHEFKFEKEPDRQAPARKDHPPTVC
jgi:hypothetical protein